MPEVLCELACEREVGLPILTPMFVGLSIPRGPSTVICLDFMVTLTVNMLVRQLLIHRSTSGAVSRSGRAFRVGDAAFLASAMGGTSCFLKLTIIGDGQRLLGVYVPHCGGVGDRVS